MSRLFLRYVLLEILSAGSLDWRLERLVVLVTVDLEKYRPKLSKFGLSAEEEDHILEALWKLMDAVSDRAFGMHPAQQIPENKSDEFASAESGLVQSTSIVETDFQKAAKHANRDESG